MGASGTAAAPASNAHPLRRGAAASPSIRRWRLTVAASIALAIGLGAGLLAGRDRDTSSGLQIAALADPALEAALATVPPSGERSILPNGNEIAAIASFRGGEGELCREFEYDRVETTVVAVACRESGEWHVRFAFVAAGAPEDGYAPASSFATLDAYLASTDAGLPLSGEEEAAALSQLDQ